MLKLKYTNENNIQMRIDFNYIKSGIVQIDKNGGLRYVNNNGNNRKSKISRYGEIR